MFAAKEIKESNKIEPSERRLAVLDYYLSRGLWHSIRNGQERHGFTYTMDEIKSRAKEFGFELEGLEWVEFRDKATIVWSESDEAKKLGSAGHDRFIRAKVVLKALFDAGLRF